MRLESSRAALRIARRELRGGIAGFRVFLACLVLGVAAIAAVGSLSEAIHAGLVRDGRALLGGDVTLRLTHRPATDEQRRWLAGQGRVAESAEMRAMARRADGTARTLVELKGVDAAYPLFGTLDLAPAMTVVEATAPRDADGVRLWGGVIEANLGDRLGVGLGDRIAVGDAAVEIRAVIEREPDRSTGALVLGPRLLVARDAVEASGLIKPGSLVRFHYRIGLPDDSDIEAWVGELERAFPDAGWRVRDLRNPAPGLSRFIDRLTVFLTLVGLTALLVGGVGVSNAVRSYLDGKTATIATLKCLGAPAGLVFQAYLAQIMALAAVGIAIGLAIGALATPVAGWLIGDNLPVRLRLGLHPGPLALAALFGLLSALTFTLWPLGRAREVPGAMLFRDRVAPALARPRPSVIAAVGVCVLALAATAIASADEQRFAWGFVLGAIAVFAAFRLAAWAVMRLAARARRPRNPCLRLALTALHRPGAATPGVILSLGLGLTVLVAIALIEANMSHQVNETLPEEAPGFYFIDIQPDQIERFTETVSAFPGVTAVDSVPMLRGRITRIAGAQAEQVEVPPDSQWALRGDRGLTWAATPPPSARIVAGEWWPEDYDGPALISFDEEIAAGFGVGVGDELTLNILGREVTATIANLRRIDWGTLGINFVIVFAPGVLNSAPQTHIATVHIDPASEGALEKAVIDAFPNVSAIRMKEALASVNRILGQIGVAVRSTAAIALVAGMLVLAGAVAAGHARRVYDGVVLKVLGASRREVLSAYVLEYALLGLVTAAISAGLGVVVAWVVITRVMHAEWTFFPSGVVVTTLLALAITVVFGFAGTWRALGEKAAPLLRNE